MSVRSALSKRIEFEHPLDSHPETRLDFDEVRRALTEGYDRPFLLADPQIIRTKTRRFKAAMPRVQPHYAVKANPHATVLRTLIEEGAGFEIASIAELDMLLELGVPAAEVQDVARVFAGEQVRALEAVQGLHHATAGDYRVVGAPVRLGTERFPYPSAAPSLGQHTFEVLDELGFPRDEVDRLVAEGVALTS